jgi:RHS repeat-associated protein
VVAYLFNRDQYGISNKKYVTMKHYFRFICYTNSVMIISLLSTTKCLGQASLPVPYSSSATVNYIRSWDASVAQKTSSSITPTTVVDSFIMTTQYFDGLGRLLQKVSKQISPLRNDMVTPNIYDNLGREQYKYLPFVANNTGGNSSINNGNCKLNPFQEDSTFSKAQYPGETYFYRYTNFETSPNSRILKTFDPGNSWVGGMGSGNEKSNQQQYFNNTILDSVQKWGIDINNNPIDSGTYGTGLLYKNIIVDEQGHNSIEYKDYEGHIILKKIQLIASPSSGHSGWLCTYYIYDIVGNLRWVLQPEAVQLLVSAQTWVPSSVPNLLPELAFYYQYDQRNRVTISKLPGAGQIWNVYDVRNRLIMTQDSNLRVQGKWLITKYDSLNRIDTTGLLTDPNNRTIHQSNAYFIVNYPNTSGGNFEILSESFYDNYNWIATTGAPLTATMASINNSAIITSLNTAPLYAQPVSQSILLESLPTGGMSKVLGSTGQYLFTIYFYDDRSRLIQGQSVNYTGGIDTITMQYNFAGIPLRSIDAHKKNNFTAQNHIVVSKMDYDQDLRLKHIWKNIDNAPADQLIDSIQYNELGQQKVKYLGNSVDSVVNDYNIRGWLTGINKNYVAGIATHFFGMELGYDKTSSVAPGNTYASARFNGNIDGIAWKSAGCGVNRKYEFTYDSVDRITSANFNQYNGSVFDKSAGIDFSVGNINYDPNGNILTMEQKGFTVGGSNFIDQLKYTYQTNGNKLNQVIDTADNPSTLLGDFHYLPSGKLLSDYTYDGNGNLTSDNNKAIRNIHYNFLNLPDSISFTGEGYIKYIYDDAGNKLQKMVFDSLRNKGIFSTYIGNNIYQRTCSPPLSGGGTDTLQFITHEEGHARWAWHKYTNGTTAYKFEYDFFEKDHLGNTRMVLTQQRDTSNYLASMEGANRSTETQLFGNITNTSYPRASIPGYPVDFTFTNPNDSVSKVDYNGTSGQKTGPSLLLKVMSGDVVKILVQSYYNSGSGTTNNSSFNDVLNSLASGLVNLTNSAHGAVANLIASTSSVYTGLTSFLGTDETTPSGLPKAYLNYVFLDDQFNYVSSLSGAVAAASTTYTAGKINTVAPGSSLTLTKNGYLYIWVSNETQGWDVFFDNLSVQYNQGPVLEENHYYPFGLTMAGISDKALKTNYAENKYRYNKGSELQNKEFSDGTGLEMYETSLRELDPQLGRWWQIDSKPDYSQSLYASMGNNPILYNDALGDTTVPGAGFWSNVWGGIKDGGGESLNFVKSLGTTQGWKNLGSGLLSLGDRANPTSVNGIIANAETAVKVGSYVKNIPNMTKDQIGHDLGYGLEKTGEAVVLSKGAGLALPAGAVSTAPIEVTEASITQALQGSTMKTLQSSVSIPMVENYVRLLEGGSQAPAIKVAEGVIIDGNHRYIAGRLFGSEPAIVPGTMSASSAPLIRPVQQLAFDPLDWLKK